MAGQLAVRSTGAQHLKDGLDRETALHPEW